MLNKCLRFIIIGMIKGVLPVVILLLLAPRLLQLNQGINLAQHFFQIHQTGFLVIHALFYLLLYGLWPSLVNSCLTQSNESIAPERIQSALNARWYLIGCMALFELMVWWR